MIQSSFLDQIKPEVFKKYRDFLFVGNHIKYIPNNIKLARDQEKTEVHKYLELEIKYMIAIIHELRSIADYFKFDHAVVNVVLEAQGYELSDGSKIDVKMTEQILDLGNIIKSRFIAVLLADIFGIVYHKTMEPMNSILKKLDGVIYFLRHIGTVPGIMKVFEVMFNVKVDVTCPRAGVIRIKLLGDTSSNIFGLIACSCTEKDCDPPVIIVNTRENPDDPNSPIVEKALYYDMTIEGYEQSVYNFIKRYIPAGRVVEFVNKDDKKIDF